MCLYFCKNRIVEAIIVEKILGSFLFAFLFGSLTVYLLYCIRIILLFIKLDYCLSLKLSIEGFFYINFPLFLLGVLSFIIGILVFMFMFEINVGFLISVSEYIIRHFLVLL